MLQCAHSHLSDVQSELLVSQSLDFGRYQVIQGLELREQGACRCVVRYPIYTHLPDLQNYLHAFIG